MTLTPGVETVVVSNRRLFRVRVAEVDPPRLMKVTIVLDGRFEWTLEQPGWRPLAVGTGESESFLWSAREVITLPTETSGAPAVDLVADEDILAVFKDCNGWVLVCETSLRRVIDGQETSRIELDAVIEACFWASDDEIVVRVDDGSEHRASLRGANLIA